MAEDAVFINNSINEAFLLYSKNYENEDKDVSIEYNSFMCSVARMLIIIYGNDIYEHYDNEDVKLFNKLILKYDFPVEDYKKFRVIFEKFYSFNKKIEDKPIKKKNKYFNLVQKYLIDMMIARTKKEKVDKKVIREFYSLLFTANSKSFYQKSYAVMVAYNPYEIDEYAKSKKIAG